MRGRITFIILLLTWMSGCQPGIQQPVSTEELPPVYPRSAINDPKAAESAKEFTAWINQQRADEMQVFGRIEVLPPVSTLEPYGIGTYQKFLRLPVILTTGPGWAHLDAEQRESLAAGVFSHLSERLKRDNSDAALRPTVTIQTPEGLELAWINLIIKGRRILHGDGE